MIVPELQVAVDGALLAIYLASPISTFSQPWYDDRVGAVRRKYPAAKIVESRRLYHRPGEWFAAWPIVLRLLDRLVFFTDEVGLVGRGTYTEVESAAASGRPVELLEPDGTFLPYGEALLAVVDENDWVGYALITYPRKRAER